MCKQHKKSVYCSYLLQLVIFNLLIKRSSIHKYEIVTHKYVTLHKRVFQQAAPALKENLLLTGSAFKS